VVLWIFWRFWAATQVYIIHKVAKKSNKFINHNLKVNYLILVTFGTTIFDTAGHQIHLTLHMLLGKSSA